MTSLSYACVEQAVVYSTLPQEYSTLTFRGEVVAGGGGVEERSKVMYCVRVRLPWVIYSHPTVEDQPPPQVISAGDASHA